MRLVSIISPAKFEVGKTKSVIVDRRKNVIAPNKMVLSIIFYYADFLLLSYHGTKMEQKIYI